MYFNKNSSNSPFLWRNIQASALHFSPVFLMTCFNIIHFCPDFPRGVHDLDKLPLRLPPEHVFEVSLKISQYAQVVSLRHGRRQYLADGFNLRINAFLQTISKIDIDTARKDNENRGKYQTIP